MKINNAHFYFQEQIKAEVASLKNSMRAHAMTYRECIAPEPMGNSTFAQRCNRAAKYLQHAIDYRNMARSLES